MTVGGWEANLKRAVSLPSSVDQLVADDLDDLLGGRERGKHFSADGFGADVLDEVVDDVEVDVGFEQGDADFAQGFGDVFFSERALAAKDLEGALQFVCKVLKHRSRPVYRDQWSVVSGQRPGLVVGQLGSGAGAPVSELGSCGLAGSSNQ